MIWRASAGTASPVHVDAAVKIPSYNTRTRSSHKAWYGAQWLFLGRGPGTTPDTHLVGFARSEPGLDRAPATPLGRSATASMKGAALTPIPRCRFHPMSAGPTRAARWSWPLPIRWRILRSQMNLMSDRRDVDVLVRGRQDHGSRLQVRTVRQPAGLAVHPTDSLKTDADGMANFIPQDGAWHLLASGCLQDGARRRWPWSADLATVRGWAIYGSPMPRSCRR